MTEQGTRWKNRITRSGMMDPRAIAANPLNWRIHNLRQKAAVKDSLTEVGWVRSILINETTGFCVDGHLRVAVAIEEAEPLVPVDFLDLTQEEERKILASLDPLGAMAEVDSERLRDLHADLRFSGDTLASAMAELEKMHRAPAALAFLDRDAETKPDVEPEEIELPSDDDDSPATVFFQLSFAVTERQRSMILAGLNVAKRHFETNSSMEALARLCEDFQKQRAETP